MEMGIRVEILGMGSDSVEFPLSRSTGEGREMKPSAGGILRRGGTYGTGCVLASTGR